MQAFNRNQICDWRFVEVAFSHHSRLSNLQRLRRPGGLQSGRRSQSYYAESAGEVDLFHHYTNESNVLNLNKHIRILHRSYRLGL